MQNMAAERHSIQDRIGRNDPDQKMHTYEVRPREDHHGVDLISHMLPFGRLLYLEVREAVAYAKFYSRSQNTVIRVYDAASNVIETHEHAGDFKAPQRRVSLETSKCDNCRFSLRFTTTFTSFP